MTIKFLEAKNFRSFKDVRIDFSDKINVVIGENDAGKTNVLRMIDLIARNNPSGDDYISWHGGDMSAKMGLAEGQVIERFRNSVWYNDKKDPEKSRYCAGTTNEYRIKGQKEPFKSFGVRVPEHIQKIINISDTNIHFQLEGPFLLGKNPPDVARYYNNAVNLDIIDRSISNIAKTLREEKAEFKKLKSDRKDQQKKLKSFAWLVKAEKKIIELEKIQVTKQRLEREYVELSSLLDELKKLNEKYDNLNKIVQHESKVDELIDLGKKIETKTNEYNELEDLLNELISLQGKSERLEQILSFEKQVNDLVRQSEKIEKLKSERNELAGLRDNLVSLKKKEEKYKEILKHESKVNELIELDKTITAKTNEYNELFDLTEQWDKLKKDLVNFQKQEKAAQAEFDELMPSTCPLCGRSDDDDCEHL